MLGRAVVAQLAERRHDVRVLSRSAPAPAALGASHHRVDVVTGDGLRDALGCVDAVVDATNTAGSGRKAAPVLVDGCRHLLDAEAAEGVEHHLAISIVGIDAVPFSYYRTKLAQEAVVEQGPVAWSLVRATQFHQLLDLVFTTTAPAWILPAMSFPLAPVDPRFLAQVLADGVEAGARGRLPAVAGPTAQPLDELARAWGQARARRTLRVKLPLKGAVRRALAAGALVPDDEAVRGGPGFEAWLREHPGRQLSVARART